MIGIFLAVSALGAMARFGAERWSTRTFGERWPWGTLLANVLGSFLLGAAMSQPAQSVQLIAAQAFCGAFTTFGGFISQSAIRMRHSESRSRGLLYLVLTVAASIGAAALGMAVSG